MKREIKNLEELDIFTQGFLDNLIMKDTATIIPLSGDLGAGKTTFVKSIAQHLDIKEEVTSPTFVIQKEYEIPGHSLFKKLIHIDAYRLESKSELEYLKWIDNINTPENLIFIEWPEQVEGIDLPQAQQITLTILENEAREITYS